MKILNPVDEPSEALQLLPKRDGESGQPQQLADEPQKVAELLGRQNAVYDRVWSKAQSVAPQWLPIECDSYRRALLLASSAIQHRTRAFEVRRRGRIVCIRFIQSDQSLAAAG
jgi:hypothetical protein